MAFILNEGQREGVIKAIRWYYNDPIGSGKPAFFFTGSAGTGKSSSAKTAIEMMGLESYQVIYATFTGKAATVLRSKGCQANTIHSLFYRILQGDDGKVHFYKKRNFPNTIKLIVIDEVSMVDNKMMEDLMSFGIPLLCLGDPGQIPAMYYPNTYLANPDVFLTQVMRQKGESGILKMATIIRNGGTLDYGQYNESRVIRFSELHDIEKYDMVLCWSNKTRKEINTVIRKKLGLDKYKYPQPGEKLLCLRNNYNYNIVCDDDIVINPVNGMFMMNNSETIVHEGYLNMNYTPDFLNPRIQQFKTPVSLEPFDNPDFDKVDKSAIMNIDPNQVVLTYGYASTVHKSQGSQWPNVLFIADYRGPKDQYKNLAYTAITRASESVTYVKGII